MSINKLSFINSMKTSSINSSPDNLPPRSLMATVSPGLKSTVSFLGSMKTSVPGDSLKVPFNTLPNAPRPISSPNTTCSGRTSQLWRVKMVDFDLKCK